MLPLSCPDLGTSSPQSHQHHTAPSPFPYFLPSPGVVHLPLCPRRILMFFFETSSIKSVDFDFKCLATVSFHGISSASCVLLFTLEVFLAAFLTRNSFVCLLHTWCWTECKIKSQNSHRVAFLTLILEEGAEPERAFVTSHLQTPSPSI